MASESKSRRLNTQPARRSTHRQRGGWRDLLNMDSEQSMRLLLMGGVVAVILAALGFIGVGYYVAEIRPRNRTVLSVDNMDVSFTAMKRRMIYEVVQNPVYRQVPQALPQAAQDAIVEEQALIRHAQEDLGLEISEEDFQNQLLTRVGVGPDASQTAFAEALATRLDQTGLHEDEYRQMVRAELIRQKARAKIEADLPESVTQAKVEVIAVATRDEAEQAKSRIAAGEDWATVAKELSAEPDVADTGGLHDYGVENSFNATYDDYAFSADVGAISDPLEAAGGNQFYIVRVLDRSEQPVKDEQKATLVSNRYNEWLDNAKEKMNIDTGGFDSDTQQELLIEVVKDAPPAPQPQQQQQSPIQVQPSDSGDQQPPASDSGSGDAPAAPDSGSSNPPVESQPVGPGAGNGQ